MNFGVHNVKKFNLTVTSIIYYTVMRDEFPASYFMAEETVRPLRGGNFRIYVVCSETSLRHDWSTCDQKINKHAFVFPIARNFKSFYLSFGHLVLKQHDPFEDSYYFHDSPEIQIPSGALKIREMLPFPIPCPFQFADTDGTPSISQNLLQLQSVKTHRVDNCDIIQGYFSFNNH